MTTTRLLRRKPVKCSECGYLTVARAEQSTEVKYSDRRHTFDPEFTLSYFGCFARVCEFDGEFHRERQCRAFIPYRHGDSPAQHRRAREARSRQRLQLAVATCGAIAAIVGAVLAGLATCY